MNKCVVIYSGGMDSFTLLNALIKQRSYPAENVYALSFDYGQRHSKELHYAAAVCAELSVNHKVVDIKSIQGLLGGSSLTDDIPVPEGHYEEASMKATVVPNRNMILLSLATGYAVTVGSQNVYYGAHAGDHAIYPDCRAEFVTAMNDVTRIANYDPVEIITPYQRLSKGGIACIGASLDLDYGKAWTCYNGREKACGKCGACQERIEAMEIAGIKDPMEYENG